MTRLRAGCPAEAAPPPASVSFVPQLRVAVTHTGTVLEHGSGRLLEGVRLRVVDLPAQALTGTKRHIYQTPDGYWKRDALHATISSYTDIVIGE